MEQPRLRPFLDTNVIFSGLRGSGPPSAILERHVAGEITIVVSRLVLDELVRTIRRKHPAILPVVGVFLTNAPPEVCDDPTPEAFDAALRCIHPKDAPILAAALQSRVDCIVSGNTRHFTPEAARCAGMTFLTPAAYLADLSR
ncbi:MAG: PIN domain-containing protein [Thermomicrobiales bacterium]